MGDSDKQRGAGLRCRGFGGGAWLGVAMGLLCLLAVPTCFASHEHNVWVLHSYHKAPWTDSMQAGIEQAMADSPGIHFLIELYGYQEGRNAGVSAAITGTV